MRNVHANPIHDQTHKSNGYILMSNSIRFVYVLLIVKLNFETNNILLRLMKSFRILNALFCSIEERQLKCKAGTF